MRLAFSLVIILTVAAVAKSESVSLETLLADYARYGMPLPTKQSILVESTPSGVVGFRDENGFMLSGFARVPNNAHYREIKSNAWVSAYSRSGHGTSWTHSLPMAIQCFHHGDVEAANALLEYERNQTGKADRAAVCDMAWCYVQIQIAKPGVDRDEYVSILDRVIEAGAASSYILAELQELKEAIRLTTANAPQNVDCIERHLRNLTECTVIKHFGDDDSTVSTYDHDFYEILIGGFDSVPTLIRYREDKRVTRQMIPSNMGKPPTIIGVRRVGDIANTALEAIMGDNASLDMFNEAISPPSGERILQWLTDATAVGESKYYQDCLVRAIEADDAYSTYSEEMLHILARRYPQDLISVYELVCQKYNEWDSGKFASVISQCVVPRELGIRSLVSMTGSDVSMRHRISAAKGLEAAGYPYMGSICRNIIEDLPGKGGDNTIGVFGLALRVPDKSLSQLFMERMQSYDAQTRMDACMDISNLLRCGPALTEMGKTCGYRLLILLTGDGTIMPEYAREKDGYEVVIESNGFESQITVGDFAAVSTARVVGVDFDDATARKWNSHDWAVFRASVGNRLREQLCRLTDSH